MDGVKIKLKEDETDVICEQSRPPHGGEGGRYGKFWPALATLSART